MKPYLIVLITLLVVVVPASFYVDYTLNAMEAAYVSDIKDLKAVVATNSIAVQLATKKSNEQVVRVTAIELVYITSLVSMIENYQAILEKK